MARIFKRVGKKESLLEATFRDIAVYNASVGKHRRINITKSQIKSYSEGELRSLRRSVANIVTKTDHTIRGKKSIAAKTRSYSQRKRPDDPSYLQQLYYNNFLRAAVKTGNKTAFNMAKKMGPVWVSQQIISSAFEIYDLYNEDENESFQIDRFSDDELSDFGFDPHDPEKFKFGRAFRNSEHANKINLLNKHVFDSAKVRIKTKL